MENTVTQKTPYQLHQEIDPNDPTLTLQVGKNDLFSVWNQTLDGSHHYYYVCDRLVIDAVCGYRDLAKVLYNHLTR
jgi:hypothetical protein